jgi:putative flippase GtrA
VSKFTIKTRTSITMFQKYHADLYKYIKFIFGGGISLLLNLLATYLLTEFFSLWHMVSFGIALGLEIIFLFVYHSFITFRKAGRFHRFVIVLVCISVLNWFGVYLGSEVLGVYYLVAIVVVALVISVFNYLINKKLVFH